MNLCILLLGAVFCVVTAERSSEVLRLQGKRQLVPNQEERQQLSLPPAVIRYLTEAQQSARAQNYNLQEESYSPQAYAQVQAQAQAQAQAQVQEAPQHITYGFTPQPQQQQQQYQQQQVEYASQPIQYQQQPTKAGPQVQKLVQAHFSPASEVSSFRFTSPLVTYSNHGVLSQLVGKAPGLVGAQAQPAQAASKAAPQRAHQAAVAPAPQQYEYAESPEIDYASAQPQKIAYQQYAQLPQQLAYSSAPHRFVYAQPNSKVVYAQGPQQFSGAQPSPQQVVYTQPQNAPSQQQFAYSFAAPQAAQSNSHPVYSSPKYTRPSQYYLQ